VKGNLWGRITIIGFLVIGIGASCGPRITLLTPTPGPAAVAPAAEVVDAVGAPVEIPSSTPIASVDYQSVEATPNDGVVRVGPRSTAVNIRRGPATTYEVIGVIGVGETARVLFRDATSMWFNVVTDGGIAGWVAADLVVFVSGSADRLMVATVEPAAPIATVESPPDEDAPEDEPPVKAPTPPTPPTETPGLAITKEPPPGSGSTPSP